jgi:antitoxin FitA
MPVNFSIKNVPDAIAAKLKERAARHHRSLQEELMAIIEEAIKEQPA